MKRYLLLCVIVMLSACSVGGSVSAGGGSSGVGIGIGVGTAIGF